MRTFMTSTLGAILVLAGITGTAGAANFTDNSFGISIDVDDAMSKLPQMRDVHNFTTQDKSAALMIKRIHDLSITDFVEHLHSVGYRDTRDGVILGMTDEPSEAKIESGRGLLIPVRGRISKHKVKGVIGAYSGHDGQGFLVIATAKPENWAAWNPRMNTMFSSVRFVKVDRAAMIKDWENRLKGKKLQSGQARVARGARQTSPHGDYYLCSDGTAIHKSGPVGRAPRQNMTVYNRGRDQRRGTWFVIVSKGTPYLIVRDDREQKLMLEDEGDNFMLHGKRYIITANNLCK